MLHKHLSFWLAIAGLLLAISLIVRLQASLNIPVPEPRNSPLEKPYAHSVGASGLIEALGDNVSIGSPVGGLVMDVAVEVWDDVKAGDVLFRLDARELSATLAPQKAQVKVYEAQLQRILDRIERLQSVASQGASPMEEIRLLESDAHVARAQIEVAEASVAQTIALIERLTVRAPKEGTILKVNIREGEYASAATTDPLMILGRIDMVQIRADIDEQLASRIQQGAKAVGQLKGAAPNPIELQFVRIEPFVIPKQSLTGAPNERVDTRVLQVIYSCPNSASYPMYVGQQMDIYIEDLSSLSHSNQPPAL